MSSVNNNYLTQPRVYDKSVEYERRVGFLNNVKITYIKHPDRKTGKGSSGDLIPSHLKMNPQREPTPNPGPDSKKE